VTEPAVPVLPVRLLPAAPVPKGLFAMRRGEASVGDPPIGIDP
jgi:hypothetical protein